MDETGRGGIYGTSPVPDDVAQPSQTPWARWSQKGGRAWAMVDASGPTELQARPEALELRSAALAGAGPVAARAEGGRSLSTSHQALAAVRPWFPSTS